MKQIIRKIFPHSTRIFLRRIMYFPGDIFRRMFHADSMMPPKSLFFIGDGNFEDIGREFMAYFKDLGNLQPDDAVLDIGCGVGRMAIPLTDILSAKGRYEGFDIVPAGIRWCQKKITGRYPNFHFQVADIQNKAYNRRGTYRAEQYRFPYPDDSFDFIFATSVFTHMYPAAVENYIAEIGRVLKKGKKCLLTFFIMNDEARGLMNSGKSGKQFVHEMEGFWTIDKKDPECAIAYHEDFIRDCISRNGLKKEDKFFYGSWSGRPGFLSYQDIVIASRL